MEHVLNYAEAALVFNVDSQTIRAYCNRGLLTRAEGGVTLQSVEEYIANEDSKNKACFNRLGQVLKMRLTEE